MFNITEHRFLCFIFDLVTMAQEQKSGQGFWETAHLPLP